MSAKNINKIRKTKEDWAVDIVVYIIMAVVFLACLYPFYYSLVISFNEGIDASRGGIFFWPRKFTLENYQAVFKDENLLKAYGVTISRTLIGTVSSVLFHVLRRRAYPVLHPDKEDISDEYLLGIHNPEPFKRLQRHYHDELFPGASRRA